MPENINNIFRLWSLWLWKKVDCFFPNYREHLCTQNTSAKKTNCKRKFTAKDSFLFSKPTRIFVTLFIDLFTTFLHWIKSENGKLSSFWNFKVFFRRRTYQRRHRRRCHRHHISYGCVFFHKIYRIFTICLMIFMDSKYACGATMSGNLNTRINNLFYGFCELLRERRDRERGRNPFSPSWYEYICLLA